MANQTVNPYGVVVGAADVYNNNAGAEQEMTFNNRGDQRVAQSLPEYAELVRMGVVWTCRIATASAFTYVAAMPTTRAELVLYNNEPSAGKSLILLSAFMYNITSMGAAQPITLIAQNVPAVGTAPSDDTAQLISSHSGRKAYGGNTRRAVANTTAGQAANLWTILASVTPSPTTNLGAAIVADLHGRFIVPPQGVFALAGIAGTAAGTAIIGVTWAELQLTLGN